MGKACDLQSLLICWLTEPSVAAMSAEIDAGLQKQDELRNPCKSLGCAQATQFPPSCTSSAAAASTEKTLSTATSSSLSTGMGEAAAAPQASCRQAAR